MTIRMTCALGGWLALTACGGSTDLVAPSGGGLGGTAGGSPGGAGGGSGGAACYSPHENLGHAYDGTLAGCSCTTASSICIQGVALICESNRWQAVEDGPCMPTPDGLDCQGEITSPADCLTLFQTCVELGNGQFCGLGRVTSLCPNGVIVQTTGQCYADGWCYELPNGLWCTGG